MAGDVVAVASATGLGLPVLIGHSYGGAVAGEAVARFPDRFAAVVFLDPAGDVRNLPEEELAAWRASMARTGSVPPAAPGSSGSSTTPGRRLASTCSRRSG
jgi:pimeloyl-ACP methyl ester carboxylesterase